MSYIPNLLTLLRLAAAPVLVVLLRDQSYGLALAIFLLAGISDGLDGYLAKRFDCESRLGAILDPVADKVLVVSACVMLTLLDHLPFWLLVAIVFRDLLIIGGYLVLVTLHGSVQMRPSIVSKLNTVVQIALVIVVLAAQAWVVDVEVLTGALIVVVSITTTLSGAHYVWVWGIKKEDTVDPEPGSSATASRKRPARTG
ncbi:MAG: CDP-alcohol phosphatidyltransferase family protein [Gammaproteobacteria bacterium]|nr:CDP-alcohol phosphatidyltransferase family protein [Gammaproteobacteria bacterium]